VLRFLVAAHHLYRVLDCPAQAFLQLACRPRDCRAQRPYRKVRHFRVPLQRL
jgi:hypothetical protein